MTEFPNETSFSEFYVVRIIRLLYIYIGEGFLSVNSNQNENLKFLLGLHLQCKQS